MFHIGFKKKILEQSDIRELNNIWKRCASSIIYCTTLAGSGHPGGSLSSLHVLITIYSNLKYNPKNPADPSRDRIIVSNGHISPGTYSVLGEFGYFPVEDMLLGFRKEGTIFAGHVEPCVPGVEWCTGNLGQGLSAAAGSALSARLRGADYKTVVLMGDGEQQKGQNSEARRFAVKFKLNNLIGIIDYNKLQIGGSISEIMPQNIADNYTSDGWNVMEIADGHDFEEIYEKLRKAYFGDVQLKDRPTVLLANTIMGKGVSFMENDAQYHGKAPSMEQARQALREIGVDDKLDYYIQKRKTAPSIIVKHSEPPEIKINTGKPHIYNPDEKLDNRSAYGNALRELAELNNSNPQNTKIVGLTCDLEGSVKMTAFKKVAPDYFFESGIQEHSTATISGRLSKEGFQVFFSTFGVFGVAEVYNQQRLNDINQTNLKLVCTHLGLDVGEDGPTHQNIDYIGLMSSLYNYKIFIPADPNQTDRIIRYIAKMWGNFFVGMGRSRINIITTEDGKPFFDEKYRFEPAKADLIRKGTDAAIMAIGPMVNEAMKAHHILKEKNYNVAIVNMASVRPLDEEAVINAAKTGVIVTAEDHNINSGFGNLVAAAIAANSLNVLFKKLGVNYYGSSGKPGDLFRRHGIDAENIAKTVEGLIKKKG